MIGYGDTFMFADENDPKGHLRIIITKPNEQGEVVTVPVTTRRKYSDAIVPLEANDHPRITHSSVVEFAYAKVMTILEIEALIKSYDAKRKEPMDEKVLDRCRKGAVESDNTPNGVRSF